MTASPLSEAPDSLASLRRALFGPRADQLHGPWKNLFGSSLFSFQEGLTHQARVELSYQRLRIVNEAVGDPGSAV